MLVEMFETVIFFFSVISLDAASNDPASRRKSPEQRPSCHLKRAQGQQSQGICGGYTCVFVRVERRLTLVARSVRLRHADQPRPTVKVVA